MQLYAIVPPNDWRTPEDLQAAAERSTAEDEKRDEGPAMESNPIRMAALVAMLASLVVAGSAGAVSTHRISVADWEGQASGASGIFAGFDDVGENVERTSISADGRYVAFVSAASNLVSGDTNGSLDVFVRDRVDGQTERVSVSDTEAQANGTSGHPSISADGRWVAFDSTAPNLVAGGSTVRRHVFLRDRASGTTRRVSSGQANGSSRDPSLAVSGTRVYVAFSSAATNLVGAVGDDANGTDEDVFVYDNSDQATERVSHSTAAGAPQGDGASTSPEIAAPQFPAPGSFGYAVAFRSRAGNLVPGDTNGAADVFVARRTGQPAPGGSGTIVRREVERVSVSSSGSPSNGASGAPAISADGGFVAFESLAWDLVGGDTNGRQDVFVRDLAEGQTTRVSVSSGEAQANGDSSAPSVHVGGLTSDVLRVAFASSATNLAGGDTNGVRDVFVRNGSAGTTARASVAWGGAQAAGESVAPALAGGYVAFASRAPDLVALDTNSVPDIFVRNSSGPAPAPPDTRIDSGPPDLTGSASATFRYAGIPVENLNHFECSLDGAVFSPCAVGGVTYGSLGNGRHSFAARAVDAGGNPDATPATSTWTVDTSKPDIEVSTASRAVAIPRGRSAQVGVIVRRLNGSSGDVRLSAGGLPAGVTAGFTPSPVQGAGSSATLTLTATKTAPYGASDTPVTITATPAGAAVGIAPRLTALGARVTPDCKARVTTDYLDVRASCIFRTGPSRYAINGDARINGLSLAATPLASDPSAARPASTLELDTTARTVRSSAKYVISTSGSLSVPLHATKLDWDLRRSRTVEDAAPSGVKRTLHGLPIDRLKVAFRSSGTALVTPTLRLGFWPFNSIFGSLTATAEFTTSNGGGADFSGLELKADKIEGYGVRLTDVALKWRSGGNWSGKARVALLFLSPVAVDGAFSIKDGDFDYVRAYTTKMNKPIGGGVFLQRIGFEARGSPPKLLGEVKLSAGPEVLDDVAAISIDGSLEARFGDPFTLVAKGTAKIGDRFDLAEAEARYSSTGLFQILGKVDADLGIGYFHAGVFGWADDSAFSLEGSGRGCIEVLGPNPCASASAIASTKGIAACIDVWGVAGGIGYLWKSGVDALGGFGGCDLGPYRPAPTAASAQAGGARSVRLPSGLPAAVLRVRGQGRPPAITLNGPRGETITATPALPLVGHAPLTAAMAGDATYFALRAPRGGTWTITPAASSAPIAAVEIAEGRPQPRIRAWVERAGARRTLRWRLRATPGQRVTFAEVGRGVRNAIGATTRARGRVRFSPAEGRADAAESSPWWNRTECRARASPSGPTGLRPRFAPSSPASCGSSAAAADW